MAASPRIPAEMEVEQRQEEGETVRRPSIEKKPMMVSSADAVDAVAFGKLPEEIIEQ
jgi:hypothetical protein